MAKYNKNLDFLTSILYSSYSLPKTNFPKTPLRNGIKLSQTISAEIKLDIVEGSGPHTGRVQITVDGVSGSVCGYGWGEKDAEVFCREKGYR